MTNLVEVEDFTLHSEEKRTSAFQLEVKTWLERHPDTQYVDILLNDLNGVFRGKRIPVSALPKLEKGCYFPASVFAMDILGNTVEEAGLGQSLGEPDNLCLPVTGTLVPSASDPQHIAQLLLTMCNQDGTPFDVEPRNVLNRLWQQLRNRGLFPVVAVELEFYLVDKKRDAEGFIQPPCSPGSDERNMQSQVYSVDNLDHFADVLRDIDDLARQQGIPADGALAEASPGQFEINLHHTRDVLRACDHAVQLKRLIRQVAENHGMTATFMAKPYEEYAGSGMHVHISMLDAADHNAFACDDGSDSPLMKRALAGMIDLMPASMALLAPNVNAYRRFVPDAYVPLQASWAITTGPLRCGCRAGISTIIVLSTGLRARMLIPTWWYRLFLRGCCMGWIPSCRCPIRSPATVTMPRVWHCRSARAMRCMSLTTAIRCRSYWANALPVSGTAVSIMN